MISATSDGAVWAFSTNGDAPRELEWPLPQVGDLSPDDRSTVYPASNTTREPRTIENLLSHIPAR